MTGSPFQILGLKPFLYASKNDEATLRSHVMKLARQFHPDRYAGKSIEERRRADEKSAEINRAAAVVQNPWQRLQLVLNETLPSAKTVSEKAIPEVAMEFFQVQEQAEENPGVAQEILGNFRAKVQQKLVQCEHEIEELTKSHPFEGASWPPAPEKLERLLALSQQRNYINRMVDNLNPSSKKGIL